MTTISGELTAKLTTMRAALREASAVAVRLRGVDWFAWATCGGSNVVILTTEAGVAEVLVTAEGAWVLTDEIEAGRLTAEEVPPGFEIWAGPWNDPLARQAFVESVVRGGGVISDRPWSAELPLPPSLIAAKRRLLPEELARYRALGRHAAEAMSEVLHRVRPEWTEWELAGAGAEALWRRGIEPTLTLVGGERRLPVFRHATATNDPVGARAMLVFCGRRHGLYANLTRFVYFREPDAREEELIEHVARVEAVTLAVSRPGVTLAAVYAVMARSYTELGHPGAEAFHHQGGTTGYLSREAFALPNLDLMIEENTALAWNPSLPGAKIEDTVVTTANGIEVLTHDPSWPSVEVDGRLRPDVLVRR